MILKVDLNDFIGKAEHHRMASAHPLLHIDDIANWFTFEHIDFLLTLILKVLWFFITLEVRPKVLQQSDLLLQLLRVLSHGELSTDIIAVIRSLLHVVEVLAIWIENDFCLIVEVDTSGIVAQIIA